MMRQSQVEELLKNKVSYLSDSAPEDDIAISTRIRLARNLANVPFPTAAAQEQFRTVADEVARVIESKKILGDDALHFAIEPMSPLDREVLFERRLASRELLCRPIGGALHVIADESQAVMVNEEDHLRIQALKPGFQLDAAWQAIDRLDNLLSSELDFAYDETLGYLTACPTNVGTGMRVSVMLHLPGLVLAGQLGQVVQGIAKLGLAVRGIFGEGTDNRGNLFQISNQSTLGESEADIIARLKRVIEQVIAHEKNARKNLLEHDHYRLLDLVGRSYGILRHSYILSSEEALNSLSGARFGVDMGMFSALDIHTVNELFVTINPAHLQKLSHRELDGRERDIFRAQIVREQLRKTGVN
ncbi:Protein-arginine kinase [bioreactor metagenome]|uniref:Protein-arginine kinase n=1 Tax=bioreactor metagenome TaxID=1076179 RepID=A0A645B2V8_9ZZZZ